MQTILIHGYRLDCTCTGCPEQYDVFDNENRQVGYLRLRHGCFRVDYPDAGGETLLVLYPKGDGVFDDDERLPMLKRAVEAIQLKILNSTFSDEEDY